MAKYRAQLAIFGHSVARIGISQLERIGKLEDLKMGWDEVLFGEHSVKVGDIMRGFHEKGFLDKDSERLLIHRVLSPLTSSM